MSTLPTSALLRLQRLHLAHLLCTNFWYFFSTAGHCFYLRSSGSIGAQSGSYLIQGILHSVQGTCTQAGNCLCLCLWLWYVIFRQPIWVLSARSQESKTRCPAAKTKFCKLCSGGGPGQRWAWPGPCGPCGGQRLFRVTMWHRHIVTRGHILTFFYILNLIRKSIMPLCTARGHIDLFDFEFAHKKV